MSIEGIVRAKRRPIYTYSIYIFVSNHWAVPVFFSVITRLRRLWNGRLRHLRHLWNHLRSRLNLFYLNRWRRQSRIRRFRSNSSELRCNAIRSIICRQGKCDGRTWYGHRNCCRFVLNGITLDLGFGIFLIATMRLACVGNYQIRANYKSANRSSSSLVAMTAMLSVVDVSLCFSRSCARSCSCSYACASSVRIRCNFKFISHTSRRAQLYRSNSSLTRLGFDEASLIGFTVTVDHGSRDVRDGAA